MSILTVYFLSNICILGDTKFAQEPLSITAVIGESVSLQCLVDGPMEKDPYMVQWVKGNLALGFPPLTNSRYTQIIGPRNYSLQIDDVQLSDEDEFECQITPVGLRSKVSILDFRKILDTKFCI